MHKVTIPPFALDSHQSTVGVSVLAWIEHIASGRGFDWRNGSSKERPWRAFCSYATDTNIQLKDRQLVEYFKWLHGQFNRYQLTVARPYVLFNFAKRNESHLKGLTKPRQNLAIALIRKIIHYDGFRDGLVLEDPSICNELCWRKANETTSWAEWGAAAFIRSLNVHCCPYCNAETVGTAILARDSEGEAEKVHKSDIDHILPKASYPLLALSLYNLLPACNRCNSRFKGSGDPLDGWKSGTAISFFHPYMDSIHEHMQFRYEPKSADKLFLKYGARDSPIVLSAKRGSEERVRRFVREYHIQEVYRDFYGDEISEAIRRIAICTDGFKRDTCRRLSIKECQFNNMFFCTSLDPHDINQYRFGKIVCDLHDSITSR